MLLLASCLCLLHAVWLDLAGFGLAWLEKNAAIVVVPAGRCRALFPVPVAEKKVQQLQVETGCYAVGQASLWSVHPAAPFSMLAPPGLQLVGILLHFFFRFDCQSFRISTLNLGAWGS